MTPYERILISRAKYGKYKKTALEDIAMKLWINGEISEAVKDEALEIIAARTDCEPPKTDADRIAELEAKVAEQQEIINELIGVNTDESTEYPENQTNPALDDAHGSNPA